VAENRIAFVMSARFPTEKAYGVTNRESILELLKKSYEVKVFSRPSSYMDSNFREIQNTLKPNSDSYIDRLLSNIANKGYGFTSKLAWKIGTKLVLRKNFKIIALYNPNIIWTRETEIANFLIRKLPRAKVVLEIHSKQNPNRYKKILRNKEQIIFCPINIDIKNYLLTFFPKKCHIEVASMSINPNFISSLDEVSRFVRKIHARENKVLEVGYVGKFAPGGYSKGIETLLELAKYYQINKQNFRVNVIGGSGNELIRYKIQKNNMEITDRFIQISGHIPYYKVPEIMKRMDILILPNPLSQEYDGTPLKLLEYLAVGRIVMLSNALKPLEFLRYELTSNEFISGDVKDLAEKIELAINEPKLESILLAGINYASQFTWDMRVSRIINKLKTI